VPSDIHEQNPFRWRGRGRRRPVATGVAASLVCAVAFGALATTHLQPVGASAAAVTAADLLSIDHGTGSYFGGAGGVILHRTAGGDVSDNLPDAVNVNAIMDVGRDGAGDDLVYAAGDHGALYYQVSGSSWCRISLPTAVYSENLQAIASAGPGSVQVAGSDGTIMELTGPGGCGGTFIVDARVPNSGTLHAIEHLANGVVIAAGDAGTMLAGWFDSTVHHLMFSPVVTNTESTIYGLAPSVPGVIAVGAGGLVLNGAVSLDPSTLLPSVVSTVVSHIPTLASLRDVAAGDVSTASGMVPTEVAVGDSGTVLQSVDGGVTWSVGASGTTETLHGVWTGDTGGGIAVGAGGTVVQLNVTVPSASPTPSPGGSTTSSSGGGGTGGGTTSSGGSTSSSTSSSGGGSTGGGSSSSSSSSGGGTTTPAIGGTNAGGGGSTTTVTSTGTSTVTSTDVATTEVTSVSTTTTTQTASGGGGGGSGGSGSGAGSAPAPGTPAWAKRLVDELYLEVLSRTADANGEAFWMNQVMGVGRGPVDIARSLLASDEYRANLAQSCYQLYLGRTGEPAGVASWVAAMGRGMTDEAVRLAFLSSTEFWNNSGSSARGYVDALYATLLQRDASQDPAGEGYWVSRMAAGADRVAVASALLESTEMLKQRVMGDYLTYLGRTAGDNELSYWAGHLAAGARDEDVILGFVGSTEYLSKI